MARSLKVISTFIISCFTSLLLNHRKPHKGYGKRTIVFRTFFRTPIFRLCRFLIQPFSYFIHPYSYLTLLYVLLCVNIFSKKFFLMKVKAQFITDYVTIFCSISFPPNPQTSFSSKGGFKDAENGPPAVNGLLRHILAALRYSTVPLPSGAFGAAPAKRRRERSNPFTFRQV